MPTESAAFFDSHSFLVVDDEAFIRSLLVRMLKDMGASKVTTAANGVEALAHVSSADPPPDVILADLSMPEMGGVELMRQLAGRDFAGAVILVSGDDEETLAVAAALAKHRDIAMLGHIKKPVRPEALKALLAKLG